MKKWFWGIAFFLLAALCACEADNVVESTTPVAQVPSPTVTIPVMVTNTTLPTDVPNTPTIRASRTPLPQEDDVLASHRDDLHSKPTYTPRPTFTPSSTLTPSPVPPLESSQLLKTRHPSFEEVGTFLLNLPTEYFNGVWWNPEDVASDVNIFKTFRGITEALQLIYEDVNGDQQEDLIVTDVLLTAIFLWGGDEYLTPFVILGSEWKYWPASHTSFDDWTNDGVPEVLFDYRSDSGGTGVRYYGWERFVIHCGRDECNIVWDGLLTNIYTDSNLGGLTLFQSIISHNMENGQLWLEQNKTRFSIFDSYYWPPEEYWTVSLESLKVFTSTQDIYVWDGIQFDLTETKIIDEPYIIEQEALLAADNDFDHAIVTYENNHMEERNNDFCQLFVNDAPVGDFFGCKRNFTTVEWQDVTGDGLSEIIVTALSGANPKAFAGTWPDVEYEDWFTLSDIDCVHQHLLAYQWDGTTATEIADIEGCVVQADLYGVKWSDIDNDGQVEILTANDWFTETECIAEIRNSCWFEFDYENNIFKWNGIEFVLWDTIPND